MTRPALAIGTGRKPLILLISCDRRGSAGTARADLAHVGTRCWRAWRASIAAAIVLSESATSTG